MIEHTFQPNWISPPSDTILDILEDRNMKIEDLAKKLSFSDKEIDNLLNNRIAITLSIARQLHIIFGASVEFWISRDYQYREDIARITTNEEQWIKQFPITEMKKFGWISEQIIQSELILECFRFFGVSSVSEWNSRYSGMMKSLAFRKSQTYQTKPASVATWIRQGEIIAERINCQLWNPKKINEVINRLRLLTREKDPSIFVPLITEYLAEVGVAFVIERTPSGCPVSGAVKFLLPEKALLMLSFRYLSDDHFWFSLFHELGHLVLHSERNIFIEDETQGVIPEEEEEANKFSENILIPEEYKQELFSLNLHPLEIMKFARKIGISPGIVIGQLQHFGIIPINHFNKIKHHYDWI